MDNNKKTKLMIIGFAVLAIVLVGTTYAFFNYTRTGLENTLSTSTVEFTSTDDTLLNVASDFPQDADLSNEELVTMKTSHNGVLSVSGHNTLPNGVKYSIYVIHGDDISGKQRLADSSIKFQLEPDFTSGSNGITVLTNNYSEPTNLVFDNEGKALISTGLVKNTTELTTVDYNFYMWLDASSMHVSSTMKRATLAEGNPSLADTTTGNATSSRYLKNDGVLVSDVTLYPATSDEAGKIVYTTNEFSNGYYNIKILVEAEDYVKVIPPIVKAIEKDLDTETTINFANNSSSSNGQGLYILPGTEDDDYPIYYYRGEVNNNNVIFGGFCWQMVRTTETGGIKMIYNGVVTGNGETCENTAHDDRIISSSAFNTNSGSVSDVGYMYNQRYPYTNRAAASNSIFGKAVEWDGTNYLVIEDTAGSASTNTTKDATHHYSCGTASTSSCVSVRYYYYNNYYITLTGGDTIEDALYKMTGSIVNQNIDVVTRNPGYVLNNTDSTIKTTIESWFRTNLTNEVDNTKINYVSYLEDTVYCNDRSEKTVSGDTSIPTYQESGWNPSGGDLTKYLYFETWNRYQNIWYSTTNVPSVACPNETDRFSLESSVAHLNYPVGLLTVDEIVMAGVGGNFSTANNTYYLYTGGYYWSLSPYNFSHNRAGEFGVRNDGALGNYYVSSSNGLRPVISLKLGTEFESGGNGTPTNPYVVKYN